MLVFVKLISYYDAKSQYGKSTNTGASAVLLQIAKRNLWEVEAKGGGDSFGLDWRPHIILLVDTTTEDGCRYVRRENKLELLSHMKKGGGLKVVLNVQLGELETYGARERAHQIKQTLRDECQKYRLNAFLQVIQASSFNSGVLSAIQCIGIGPLHPNTVMLGWPQVFTPNFVHLLHNIVLLDKAVLLVKGLNSSSKSLQVLENKTIDIFWVLLDGGILTLIAHILMKHPSWQTCKFRIFVIAEAVDNVEAMHENLKATLKGLRIAAEANVLVLEREGKSALCPGTELM
ncbi:hypothetical protein HDU99_004426, partial [Rhizoclosmatium hyalinum]